MKKKIMTLFLLSVAALGLASCGSNKSSKNDSNQGKVVKPTDPEPEDPVDHNPTVTFERQGQQITNIKVESSKDTIDLVIPDEIDGTPIVIVAWRAFSDSSLRGKTIDKLTIGKNITFVYFYGTEGKINDVEVSSENSVYAKSGKFLLSKDSKTFFWAPSFEISELPITVENIETYSFVNYSGASLTLPSQIKRIEDNAITKHFATVDLNEGLEYIGFSALDVDTIFVPSTVTSLRYSSFGNRLNSIFVDANNSTYDSRNNCCMVIKKETNEVVITSKAYTFPGDVTKIGNQSFAYTYNFTSITIPNTVTKIEDTAFRYCYNLESLTIPSNVEIYNNNSKLDSLAYIIQGCYKLKSLTAQILLQSYKKQAYMV